MKIKGRMILSIFAGAILVFSLFSQTNAQTTSPQMVVTWKAYGSYIPPGYGDKALPNQESRLTATLDLLVNGYPANLSNQTIYWYLNNNLIDSGIGDQSIIFPTLGTAPGFFTLKAELPNYGGATLIHEVQIPFITPKAVIEAPHPSGQFSSNPIVLQGTPYFFYVSDPGALSYSWAVNGQTATTAENPQTLQMSVDPSTQSGATFTVTLSIVNPGDGANANDSTSVVYIKQL